MLAYETGIDTGEGGSERRGLCACSTSYRRKRTIETRGGDDTFQDVTFSGGQVASFGLRITAVLAMTRNRSR